MCELVDFDWMKLRSKEQKELKEIKSIVNRILPFKRARLVPALEVSGKLKGGADCNIE